MLSLILLSILAVLMVSFGSAYVVYDMSESKIDVVATFLFLPVIILMLIIFF